jgi:putative membrane protein insertion efficiency factor
MSKKPLFYKAFLNILQLPRKIFLIILAPLGPRCKYHPSCSSYLVQAITTHGIIKGIILGILRIIRCNPFSGGGYNPVPSKSKWFADVYPNGSPRA